MNGGNVLLLALMLLPLVGALVLYPLRRNVQLAKQTAMGFALAEVVLVAVGPDGRATPIHAQHGEPLAAERPDNS